MICKLIYYIIQKFLRTPDWKFKQKMLIRGVDKFNFILRENITPSKTLENILNLFNFKHQPYNKR